MPNVSPANPGHLKPPPQNAEAEDLTQLSLEDLMNVQVTSVSRQSQRIAEAPAAIYVINQDDIARSGFTSIPELFRMVPGMNVTQNASNQWTVSSRGDFGQLYVNDLQAQIDGRSVYTTDFGGVRWDQLDYPLDDLDRVEVIRGPGATLWGSNSVNGIINIETKSARDTQGFLGQTIYGNEEQVQTLRYGGALGDNTYYDVWGKFRNDEAFGAPTGIGDGADAWNSTHGGFRIDHYSSDTDQLTLEGDAYRNLEHSSVPFMSLSPATFTPASNSLTSLGGSLNGKWTHTFSDTSDMSLQIYYDRVDIDWIQVRNAEDIGDLDFQDRFQLLPGQELVWGAGYRFERSFIGPGQELSENPVARDIQLSSLFVQDDITLVPDRLHLFAGSKFEEVTYSGFLAEPSGRLLWTPDGKNSIWTAVSRAYRTPERYERDATQGLFLSGMGPGLPTVVNLTGNSDSSAVSLTACEMGYRYEPVKTFSLDASGYYNVYHGVMGTLSSGPPQFDGSFLVIPLTQANVFDAQSFGAEISANWQVLPVWRLETSYTWNQINVGGPAAFLDTTDQPSLTGSFPHNQCQLRSYLDLPRNLQLNGAIYYVDNISGTNTPAYTRVDLGLTWKATRNLTASFVVQNLFDIRHTELVSGETVGTIIPRTYYAALTLSF